MSVTGVVRYICFSVYACATLAMAWAASPLTDVGSSFFIVICLLPAIGIWLGSAWAVIASALASIIMAPFSIIEFFLMQELRPPPNIGYFIAVWLAILALPLAVAWGLRDVSDFAAGVTDWRRVVSWLRAKNRWRHYADHR